MPNKLKITALSTLAGVLVAGLAFGTTVLEFDATGLVAAARTIVHGTCTDVQATRDANGLIVTRYTFSIADTLKGTRRTRLVLTQPGGQLNGTTTVIPGLSFHRVGDEVILFLGIEERRRCLPIGLDQGVYRVLDRPSDGARIIQRSLAGLHLIRPENRARPSQQLREGVSVEDFKRQVRARIAAAERK